MQKLKMQKFTKEHTCSYHQPACDIYTVQFLLFSLIWHCHPVHHCVLKLDFQQGGEIKTCSPLHCTGTREGSSHFLVAEAAGGKGCTGSVSACFVVVVNPSSSEHGCFLFVLLLLLFLHPENHITFLFHFHCFSSRQLPRNNT